MFTKAWKVMTPSISKKEPTVYWDWSDEEDGTRIFEALNSDLTGHPSYTVIRITRDTEADCNEEFEEQITDGYFENYFGRIRGKEIKPDKVKIRTDLVASLCRNLITAAGSDKGLRQKVYSIEDLAMAIAKALELSTEMEAMTAAKKEFTRLRLKEDYVDHSPESVALTDSAARKQLEAITGILTKALSLTSTEAM